jgi:(2S)-methylsuccinyl-CoA dehydrogenase
MMAVLTDLMPRSAGALSAAEALYDAARRGVREMVVGPENRVDAKLVNRHQHAAHGLAWVATYVEALRQMLRWAQELEQAGKFGELEQLTLQIAFGEYLAQLGGGIAMSQVEIVRPHDMGVADDDLHAFWTDDVSHLIRHGSGDTARLRVVEILAADAASIGFGEAGLDEDLIMIRDQFHRYADERVKPAAHEWHLKDDFIPMEIIQELADLGVFGLSIPEEHGGLGLSKVAMCVVTEELSRGYIGVGSLGTRTEIAGELIISAGTDDQKERILPGIISGEIIPTAVFTEPSTGSDLGSLKTRAVKDGDTYRVTGNKTWITHAARADIMTLLVRTNPDEKGYRGLSMFLAEKPRGTDDDPFPAKGMSGGEIPVLGYRGMKEYELGFDGFEVEARNLLGGEEGNGFKQLMATFESARIQTGARAVGVAQAALELGLNYAKERQQFGGPLVQFPRVGNKLAWMAVETMVARQLCWFSAREKDAGRRCDLEAGMAKLLGARVAWFNADNALQIHGGNGYAQEYEISRVLCDARILNIFEGAAEIQAQVIARRLLSDAN